MRTLLENQSALQCTKYEVSILLSTLDRGPRVEWRKTENDGYRVPNDADTIRTDSGLVRVLVQKGAAGTGRRNMQCTVVVIHDRVRRC